MPIAVHVVSQEEYDAWVAKQKAAQIDSKSKVAAMQK
jgi:heme/copper-type cytochrome/quinol oxidase subunit 2